MPGSASRFVRAVSEPDGIALLPALPADPAAAGEAEAAGARAAVVGDAAAARALRAGGARLPVLVRDPVREPGALAALAAAGADACVCAFADAGGDGCLLEELHAEAGGHGLACALDVQDGEELDRALERIDPDLVLVGLRREEELEAELERTLDVIPHVPAGTPVVAEGAGVGREQVVALERAGLAAIVVHGLPPAGALGAALRALAS